jgi:hypothetical protein
VATRKILVTVGNQTLIARHEASYYSDLAILTHFGTHCAVFIYDQMNEYIAGTAHFLKFVRITACPGILRHGYFWAKQMGVEEKNEHCIQVMP